MLSNSSSRRLSSIHEVMDCPRLSYLYPFPPMTPRFYPWLSPQQFLTSVFTSLPFLTSKKFVKLSSAIPSREMIYSYSLSPHCHIINKIIENRPNRVKNTYCTMRKDPLHSPNLRFSFLTPSEAVFFTSTCIKISLFFTVQSRKKKAWFPIIKKRPTINSLWIGTINCGIT